MTGLLFAAVAVVAAAVWLGRGVRTRRERRRLREGPGTSAARAIPVRSFDAIDRAVASRRCHCGSRLRTAGEGARQEGDRRLRMVQLVCDECEESWPLYFDVSEVLH